MEKSPFFTRLRAIPLIGILLALLSSLCIATETLCVKLISQLSPIELIVLRALFVTIVHILYLIIKRQSLLAASGEHILLCLRCCLGFFSVVCAFSALRIIPLGDSSAIIYSAPVFVTLFARILLKEPCSIVNCIAITITVIGVVLISRPSFLFETNETIGEGMGTRLLGSVLALGCATCSALVFVIIRKLQKTPVTVVVFYFSVTGVICGSILLVITGEYAVPQGLRTYLLLLLLGIAGTFGQLFMTLAFQVEQAGPVALARSTSMVIAFVYQVTILKEDILYTSVIGAVIVMLAVVIVALRKWYENKPEIFYPLFCCKVESKETKQCTSSDDQRDS